MQESRDSALKNLSVAKDKKVKIQGKLEMRRILKLRSVIRAGGKKGQRLFWECIRRRNMKRNLISILSWNWKKVLIKTPRLK